MPLDICHRAREYFFEKLEHTTAASKLCDRTNVHLKVGAITAYAPTDLAAEARVVVGGPQEVHYVLQLGLGLFCQSMQHIIVRALWTANTTAEATDRIRTHPKILFVLKFVLLGTPVAHICRGRWLDNLEGVNMLT